MRKAIGTDRRRRPDRVLQVLQEIDADVVALQEADKRIGGRGAAVPHELIDEHGMYKPVPFRVRHRRTLENFPGVRQAERLLNVNTRNLGWHGNALLVKKHIGVIDVAALDLPTLEPRGAVMAELLIGDRPIRIVGMHLDLSGLWRRRQMRAILEAIARRPQKMPTILMGDTNEWRDAGGCLKELNGSLSNRSDRSQLPRPPARSRPWTGSSSATNWRSRPPGSTPAPRRARRATILPIWARVTM